MADIYREIKRKIVEGKIAYLLVLVDETDALLRAEQETGYALIHEIVNLRTDTSNAFKCVFAGLHNIMRSAKATADNSPMTKLGMPLCVKPLSFSDARRLVRYPMSYLGLHIGDSQLMTILTESNNYPGNLHLICGELVKNVTMHFAVNHGNDDPPFSIDDSVLGNVVKNSEIRGRIREKLILSLSLDRNYMLLACSIAYLGYDSPDGTQVFSIGRIRDTFLSSERDLSAVQIGALLDEMCEMSILSRIETDGAPMYRFRRNSFRGLLGTEDDVITELLGGND
jgi:hypothetical protein